MNLSKVARSAGLISSAPIWYAVVSPLSILLTSSGCAMRKSSVRAVSKTGSTGRLSIELKPPRSASAGCIVRSPSRDCCALWAVMVNSVCRRSLNCFSRYCFCRSASCSLVAAPTANVASAEVSGCFSSFCASKSPLSSAGKATASCRAPRRSSSRPQSPKRSQTLSQAAIRVGEHSWSATESLASELTWSSVSMAATHLCSAEATRSPLSGFSSRNRRKRFDADLGT
mmetsp:Transcript_85200/g.170221  ORF Transcript_85200/g.170221 Transcript_85200/m.170221 type:complete len:228 (+) Transcript_85200:2704-3387(+)